MFSMPLSINRETPRIGRFASTIRSPLEVLRLDTGSLQSMAHKIGTALMLTLVLSFALVLAFGVFAFHDIVSVHSVDFHSHFSHCR